MHSKRRAGFVFWLYLPKDDHGIEYDLVDCEGNLIKPVYATDEYEFKVCGDCRVELE